jgi:hypothetical protein
MAMVNRNLLWLIPRDRLEAWQGLAMKLNAGMCGELLTKMDILQERRPSLTRLQRVLIVVDP